MGFVQLHMISMSNLHVTPPSSLLFVVKTSRISQQIVATDGGNRSSSVELTVIITNVHNQPPQWEQLEYWVTVSENIVRDAKIVVSGPHSDLFLNQERWCLLTL